jgi:hypothetical protein
MSVTMKTKPLFAVFIDVLLAAAAGPIVAAEKVEAKGEKLAYEVHNGYFESNKSGLKGESSYLTFTDPKAFEKVFGIGVVMGKKPKLLPKDAFESHLIVAAIKRGKSIWEYKVEKVTEDEGTVYVQYTATPQDGGGSATFASPLIISLPKGKYTAVVFLENGKKAAKVPLGK